MNYMELTKIVGKKINAVYTEILILIIVIPNTSFVAKVNIIKRKFNIIYNDKGDSKYYEIIC